MSFLYLRIKKRMAVSNSILFPLKRASILLFFIFLSCTGLSQGFIISGKVTEAVTGYSLPGVSIQEKGSLRGTFTDSTGYFHLKCNNHNTVLVISLLGYEKGIVKASAGEQVNIVLTPSAYQLGEVTISSSKTEEVIRSKSFSILDYGFYNDHLLLITFVSNLQKSQLVLLDEHGDTLGRLALPERPVKLFKDCLGYQHVIGEKNTYQVHYDLGKLHLLPSMPLSQFESVLFPCVTEDAQNLYFKKYYGGKLMDTGRFRIQTNHQIANYYAVNKSSRTTKDLNTIADTATIQRNKEEQEFLDKKEAAGMYRKPILKEFDRIHAETSLYKEIYVPLFKIRDSICIFNYVNSRIEFYSPSADPIGHTDIRFHKEKNWKNEMYIEEKGNRVFVLYENNGIKELKQVDIKKGLLAHSYKIPYPFVKNIRIKDDYIYFLYKGDDSAGSTFLSRIRMQ